MKTPTYTRLTFKDREEIMYGLWKHESFSDIAHRLGKHASTISREVNTNGGRRNYKAFTAWEVSFHRKITKRPTPNWNWYQL